MMDCVPSHLTCPCTGLCHFYGTFFLLESGFMSMVCSNVLRFPHFMISKNLPDLGVCFSEISADMCVLFLRFEWHNPVSWKLK